MGNGLIDERKAWDVKKGRQRLNIINRPTSFYNSLQVEITSISQTVATKINTPVDGTSFSLIHKNVGETIYIGTSELTGEDNGYPLEAYEVLELENMQIDNENEIYGIASSEALKIIAVAEVKI